MAGVGAGDETDTGLATPALAFEPLLLCFPPAALAPGPGDAGLLEPLTLFKFPFETSLALRSFFFSLLSALIDRLDLRSPLGAGEAAVARVASSAMGDLGECAKVVLVPTPLIPFAVV